MGTASGAITIGSLPASANPEGINLLKLDCVGKVGQSVIGPRCALALALVSLRQASLRQARRVRG